MREFDERWKSVLYHDELGNQIFQGCFAKDLKSFLRYAIEQSFKETMPKYRKGYWAYDFREAIKQLKANQRAFLKGKNE